MNIATAERIRRILFELEDLRHKLEIIEKKYEAIKKSTHIRVWSKENDLRIPIIPSLAHQLYSDAIALKRAEIDVLEKELASY